MPSHFKNPLRKLSKILFHLGLGWVLLQPLACGNSTPNATPLENSKPSPAANPPQTAIPSPAASCAEFTHPITDFASLKSVSPIGMVGGGNTEIIGRSYMFVKEGLEGLLIPVYAPTDITLFGLSHYVPMGAPSSYAPDWGLWLRVDCNPQITLQLYHLKQVSTRIEAVGPEGVSSSSALNPPRELVSFKAGEVLGYFVKGNSSIAWDFIVDDSSQTNLFANQERYLAQGSNVLHVTCPFDWFSDHLRESYYQLLAPPGSAPMPGISCGSVSRDVAGSIAGQWFLSPHTQEGFGELRQEGFYGNPFPIVLRPDDVIDFGHVGPSRDIRIYPENPSYQNPEEVREAHCYQIYSGSSAEAYLYFRMVSPDHMQLAYSPTGLCPTSFPVSNYKDYYR